MLFDLRGSGRRRTVKIVYITLAFLMGGGLVLFGIGGGGGISGGLVDAITGTSGGGDTSTDRFRKQEAEALAQTRTNPQDAPAWAALARARFQLAGAGENFDPKKGDFTAKGMAKLQSAGDAWERYLALNPKNPDDRVASLMVQAYGALNKPDKAAEAQEVITNARPTASTFTQLAVFAYEAGQTRKGDLARNKALELTPKDMREALKGQLDQAKQSAAQAAVQPSATP
jgi:tetratricopeptide (TPR) repeat protein